MTPATLADAAALIEPRRFRPSDTGLTAAMATPSPKTAIY